jgi:hypothetical protein
MDYFTDLMSTDEEISDSIRPLLSLCRGHIYRSIELDTALLRSLERDPLLADRLRRLRLVNAGAKAQLCGLFGDAAPSS